MRPIFEPDETAAAVPPAARLIDPEAFDSSEQQFSASLDEKPRVPRFVVDEATGSSLLETQEVSPQSALLPASETEPAQAPDLADPESEIGAWRSEVAARVSNYRSRRRPRAPRYPSLLLRFDQEPAPLQAAEFAVPTRQAVALDRDSIPAPASAVAAPVYATPSETTAKIIAFPRSFSAPPRPLDELAEPVFDRPRILEVPEVAPPPPALGGILIEAVEKPAEAKRPGFEIPLQRAPMGRRLFAAVIDAWIVLLALASFAYIFFKVSHVIPPWQTTAETSAILLGAFWAAYQYLLLVYSGITPGLRLAGLHLSRFDGNAAPRSARRWRVLSSLLSAFSLGLGYAWCFLDEDRLSWHDRITHTYLAPNHGTGTHSRP